MSRRRWGVAVGAQTTHGLTTHTYIQERERRRRSAHTDTDRQKTQREDKYTERETPEKERKRASTLHTRIYTHISFDMCLMYIPIILSIIVYVPGICPMLIFSMLESWNMSTRIDAMRPNSRPRATSKTVKHTDIHRYITTGYKDQTRTVFHLEDCTHTDKPHTDIVGKQHSVFLSLSQVLKPTVEEI